MFTPWKEGRLASTGTMQNARHDISLPNGCELTLAESIDRRPAVSRA